MKRDARQILTELLVLQSQAGQESAFRQIHELWAADVQRMAVARTGELQAGREVAQDAWVAIARGLPRIQDPACFPRWALQIVQRRSADWVRRRRRERSRAEKILQESERNDAPGPRAEDRSEMAQLAEALQALSQDDRSLLSLYYEAGRSVVEIGEILAVPSGTVKSRLHGVRERLKIKIEKESS